MIEKLLKIDKLPYYAVIFTSIRTDVKEEYAETNDMLEEAANDIAGFLGQEATRDGLGIAVSYWRDLDSIDQWRKNLAHISAKNRGRAEWYKTYSVRICRVESQNFFERP